MSLNRTALATAVISLTLAATPVSSAQETQSDTPIKVQTTLVSVPVIVSDRQGRYISGLKAEDFKLYQDRAEQPISYFDAAEEPLNVALLIDTSKSTEPVMDDIKSAAVKFLKELRPQDRAMIVSVDYDVHQLSQLTSERKALERSVRSARTGEEVGTVLRDGIAQIVKRSFKQVDGRKAIIVLTDGKDVGSAISEKDLLDEAAESGAMIYTVFFETMFARRGWIDPLTFPKRRVWRRDQDPLPSRRRQEQRRQRAEARNEGAVSFLVRVAEASAGRYYGSEASDLNKTFRLIAEELRHQYRLGFYPDTNKADGKRHMLRVEVGAFDTVVRARRSYQAPSLGSGS
ncbi:MAG TPA: VWA domain-containing protein [Blastocatellia bacterium]|nr:VWA domain-containing protein [Blastocatellia bacterium]